MCAVVFEIASVATPRGSVASVVRFGDSVRLRLFGGGQSPQYLTASSGALLSRKGTVQWRRHDSGCGPETVFLVVGGPAGVDVTTAPDIAQSRAYIGPAASVSLYSAVTDAVVDGSSTSGRLHLCPLSGRRVDDAPQMRPCQLFRAVCLSRSPLPSRVVTVATLLDGASRVVRISCDDGLTDGDVLAAVRSPSASTSASSLAAGVPPSQGVLQRLLRHCSLQLKLSVACLSLSVIDALREVTCRHGLCCMHVARVVTRAVCVPRCRRWPSCGCPTRW
jgi:hypothetical protein